MQNLTMTSDGSSLRGVSLRRLIIGSRRGAVPSEAEEVDVWLGYCPAPGQHRRVKNEPAVMFLDRHPEERHLFWAAFPPVARPFVWLMLRCGLRGAFAPEVALVQELLGSATESGYEFWVMDYCDVIESSCRVRRWLGLRMSSQRLEDYRKDAVRQAAATPQLSKVDSR
jgi:hypothetical protein